ncbi:sulfotransferase family protein [Crateriforma spongiae]|uniref:sulfotransferase family protein n=1 Tax=Crateriforma spongiae TaxID=2724528 RepID=UPI001445FD35|nr:sulfotransferase [Crateriforma spongiae]
MNEGFQCQPFFIVGCPRSGTTLIQVFLNRHPNVICPPETKLFCRFDGCPTWIKIRTLQRINSDLGISIPLRLAKESCGTEWVFRTMVAQYSSVRPDGAHATHFGEKTPEHTPRVARLLHFFPNARIVFIYRDGRDVSASLQKVPWLKSDFRSGLILWKRYCRHLLWWQRRQDSRVLFVRYESFVSSPVSELNRILLHLGLPGDAIDLICRQHVDRTVVPERELDWKCRALGRPVSCRVGQWKNDYRHMAKVADGLIGRELRQLGYDAAPMSSVVSYIQWARSIGSIARTLGGVPLDVLMAECSCFLVDRLRRQRFVPLTRAKAASGTRLAMDCKQDPFAPSFLAGAENDLPVEIFDQESKSCN